MDLTLIQHQNNKISKILIIMYRNKDNPNKIQLEKKLTKELTKYEKQYNNLDYDTMKKIVDTKNNYLINTIKIQLQIILLQCFHIRKKIKT